MFGPGISGCSDIFAIIRKRVVYVGRMGNFIFKIVFSRNDIILRKRAGMSGGGGGGGAGRTNRY